jgi:hypothetical protein
MSERFMQPSVARARAATLREWSDQYRRDAMVGPPSGFEEAAFMLERAARAVERASGMDSPEPPLPVVAPPPVESVRQDEDALD